MNEIALILEKIDTFIKKYYKNQLLKGLILCISLFLGLFLVITTLEYFAYFNSIVRAIFFYCYLVMTIVVIIKLILIPIFKLNKIGHIISYEYASEIIGRHFPEIKDKLLNAIQLKELSEENSISRELLSASIDQKASELSPFPFSRAIDFTINKKYLKFLFPPVVLFLFIIIASPSIITEPSKRLVNYSTFYEKQAPFIFEVLNKNLLAIQQEDYRLDIKLIGENIPDEVFIVMGGNEYGLSKENKILYHFVFKNLQKDIIFYFKADGFRSKDYNLKVIPKPIIVNFEVQLDYPLYTGKKSETIQNSGDFSVPSGTNVTWKIKTRDTKKIFFRFKDKSFFVDPGTREMFKYSQHFFISQNYSVLTQNQYIKNPDSLNYFINIIPDAHPIIDVKEYKDSLYESHFYFKGLIKDDYGFNKLLFKYKKTGEGNTSSIEEIKPININKTLNQEEFYFYFDISSLGIKSGDNIEYYFEIWDNDGINGSKSTRSQKMIFRVPTLEEIDKQTELNNEDVKSQMEQAIKDAGQLQKQIENLDKKLLEKKTINWQERKQIEDLINKQKQLQQKVEDMKSQLNENFIKEGQYKKNDENILEKQRQLEDLFNKVMTDEMKELFMQLQEMLDKLDKNKIEEALDKMKLSNKDIEKELDRNLELFRQLELEKKMNETIEKLQKLSEEQKSLSEKTLKEQENQQKLLNDQKEISEQFKSIAKDLEDIEKKNQELEDPKKLLNTSEQEKSIQQELDNSAKSLQNSKMKNAAKSQQSAAEQMEQMADNLQKQQEEMDAEAAEEDIQSLRMLLENLVKVSFNQEDLIGKIKITNITDPKYIQLMDKQKQLKDDLKMIEDSLYALSKRQTIIQSVVNREISQINDNMVKSLEALHNRNTPSAQKWQQYVMTSVNNLALLLAESLEQMQQQMQSKSSKSCKRGKCKKPGSGAPSANSMKKLQEELNKKMQSLKKQLEDGKGMGGKTGKEGQAISEQFSRLAAEQEALRKIMQQYGEELKKEGVGNDGNISEMMKKMEQTETELVNKMINNETLKRQQEILTRLLESEKAEKERELDEKRESKEMKNSNYSNPNQFFEYKKIKSKEVELLKTIPVTLTPFYKYKTNEYFYKFKD
jgi:hypothetical protein